MGKCLGNPINLKYIFIHLDLFSWDFYGFYHGKLPLNHHLGEYGFTFSKQRTSKSKFFLGGVENVKMERDGKRPEPQQNISKKRMGCLILYIEYEFFAIDPSKKPKNKRKSCVKIWPCLKNQSISNQSMCLKCVFWGLRH